MAGDSPADEPDRRPAARAATPRTAPTTARSARTAGQTQTGRPASRELAHASWGFLADAVGRRRAFAISFAVSAVSVGYLFPFQHTYGEFLLALPVVGFGLFGALSGTFVYGPELFPPSVRATGMALCNSIGRFITAAGPLVAGVIAVSWFGGDLGLAITCVAAVGLIAVAGLVFAPETRGAELPSEPLELGPDQAEPPTGSITSKEMYT